MYLTHLYSEGIFSVLIGFIIWFGLPNDPTNAYFLNEEEKRMMRVRAAQRAQYMGSEKFNWDEIMIELKDPKMWVRYVISRPHFLSRKNKGRERQG